MLAVPLFDPVDPSSDQARQLLEQELARGRYQRSDSLLARLTQWLADLWHGLFDATLGGGGPAVLLIVLGVLVVALLVWVLPKVRRERRAVRSGGAVLEDPALRADDYRARAAAARAEGRTDDALLDAFRTIVAAMAERTLLDAAPGRTAHEVGQALAPTFPDHAGALRVVADRFDAVRYGGQHATDAHADEAIALERTLQHTRPVLASPPTPVGAG